MSAPSTTRIERRSGQHPFPREAMELLRFKHPKGGDPDEWPQDLRVREWPEVAR